SARAAWPFVCSASGWEIVPWSVPSTTAAATNASHPKVAVFQCAALHRPARAARFIVASWAVYEFTTPGCLRRLRRPIPRAGVRAARGRVADDGAGPRADGGGSGSGETRGGCLEGALSVR